LWFDSIDFDVSSLAPTRSDRLPDPMVLLPKTPNDAQACVLAAFVSAKLVTSIEQT
jgi:hypothetical protein